MDEREFDVIVIGAGPAGEVLAGRVAERGHATAIVESRLVGGECAFYACMPSKALLRPAELRAEAARVPGVREAVTGPLDADAVLRRRDEVVHELDDERELAGDELLVAVGRRPASGDLGLETIGLTPGEYLPVDDRMRVDGHPWLFAIGDATAARC